MPEESEAVKTSRQIYLVGYDNCALFCQEEGDLCEVHKTIASALAERDKEIQRLKEEIAHAQIRKEAENTVIEAARKWVSCKPDNTILAYEEDVNAKSDLAETLAALDDSEAKEAK